MSNPAPPMATPPNSGGGMPKWLIILLVVLLVVVLGCCGGFVACNWMCHKAVQSAQVGLEEIKAQTQRAAEETKRQAQQNGNGGVEAPGGNETAPTGGGIPSGGGGNPSASGNTGSSSGALGDLGVGKMPSNFPSDIPVMKGLTPTQAAAVDKLAGKGTIMFTGKIAREDASAFYEKQMKDQGWTVVTNQDVANLSALDFTKDNRKTSILIAGDDKGGPLTVSISYENSK